MVRTKADGSTRVAAGGKTQRKAMNYTSHTTSPSGTGDGGKENLPGNRYFPRETPKWQKKITSFYLFGDLPPIEKAPPKKENVPKKKSRKSKQVRSDVDASEDPSAQDADMQMEEGPASKRARHDSENEADAGPSNVAQNSDESIEDTMEED